jgi:hypothetical protein
MPPFPGSPELNGQPPTLDAGCRTVYYLAEAIVGDQCGPITYKDVLAGDRVRVGAGAKVRIVAPPTFVFSSEVSGLLVNGYGWSVSMSDSSAVGDLVVGPQGLPPEVARVLRAGAGTTSEVVVTMPTTPGTYILEMVGPLERDGWTFAGDLYEWAVDVAE